jgi:transcriptional regulator with XRE-family HTH domain
VLELTTGERIKRLRKEKGMNAEALAEKCGLSPATIYRYEKGDIENFGYDKLIPLAAALNVDPSYLLGVEKTASHSADGYSEKEQRFLVLLRQLDDLDQEAIERRMKAMLESK